MNEEEIVELINISLIKEFELEPNIMFSDARIDEDLELDSLDIVDLVVVLEEVFNFKIREEESIRQIRTLGDIHRFVINKKRDLELQKT